METKNSIKSEILRRRDIRGAQRSLKRLQLIAAATEVTTEGSLDICLRPYRELSVKQSEVGKRYGYGETASQHIPRSRVYIGKTAYAAAFFYGSSNGLEYRTHRFSLVDEGINYHREPFDVDAQAIGSLPVDLEGIQTIATNQAVRNELLWLSGILENVQPAAWTGKISKSII